MTEMKTGTGDKRPPADRSSVALVTGGSRGIGRAIVQRLVADGFTVINADLVAPTDPGPNEHYEHIDLADDASSRAALERLVHAWPISTLVNNAGIVNPASVLEATIADIQAVVAVNIAGSLRCIQAVLPAMTKAGYGRIVNISSRAALGKQLRTVYSATKAGLHGMTRTIALEVARHGITVNAVGPGPIATELFHRVNPPDAPATRRIVESIPVCRMGTAADVAHAVAMFVDPRAGFITGQVLYVCGGTTVGLAQGI
jgi:NAD(P)-dependent dehydrogenase (short-subunit alcohol dehydrogenase family)